MIDNYGIIKPLLKWDKEDDFYYAIVLKRKKEHPELGNNSYQVKSYFLKSMEDLDKNYPEMKLFADILNARVYINLNRRSFETMAFQTMRKIVDQIMNKDYSQVKKAYTSSCGSFNNEPKKRWIIDVDDKDIDEREFVYAFEQCRPVENKKYLATIPTKNGYHIITNPFDIQQFTTYKLPAYDLQKDNPTILYIP